MKLVSKYDGAYSASERNDRRQKNHPAIAASYPINKRSFGYGWLVVAFAATYAGFFLLMTFNGGRFRLAIGSFPLLIAIASVWQGIGQIFGKAL
jgi:hypothetical protein